MYGPKGGRSHRTGNRDAMRRKGKEERTESSTTHDPEGGRKNGREEKDFRNLQK